jgi:hypothetical protein
MCFDRQLTKIVPVAVMFDIQVWISGVKRNRFIFEAR